MPISKRLRYEILRRDNHTCRYCGASAPDTPLTVDHVTPKALGGTDEASNFVTACMPCNSGKSSTSPDASLVEGVRDDAIRHAEMIRLSYAILVERIGLRKEYEDEFDDAYAFVAPDGWRNSVGRWFQMGVPIELVTDAATIANGKEWRYGFDRWKYLCGIVWNQITAVDAITAEKTYVAGHFHTAESLEELEIDAWKRGWNLGYSNKERQAAAGTDQPYTAYEVDDIKQLSYNEGYSKAYRDTWDQVHERYPGLLDGEYAS